MDFLSSWQSLQQQFPLLDHVRLDMVWQYRELFLRGALMTLQITFIAVLLGTAIGLIVGIIRITDVTHSRWRWPLTYLLRWPAIAYTTFFRGTPLFVQILLIHFAVLPSLIHPTDGLLICGEWARVLRQDYGAFISGLLALTLNSGAYVTEIFRAGIQSIHRGQSEAARSLGLNYWQSLRYVIVPQAFRRMLPPLGNETITLLKDSSLVSAIGLTEMVYAARTVAGAYSRFWEPYMTIALAYLAMTMLLALLVAKIEQHFRHKGGF